MSAEWIRTRLRWKAIAGRWRPARQVNSEAKLLPVAVRTGKIESLVDRDEGPRGGCSLADLAKLHPAFAADGTATAGNASQISDGAAGVVVVNESLARESKSPVKAQDHCLGHEHGEPRDLFVAPVGAIEQVLAKSKLKIGEIDLFELNEAFAAQCLACMRPLAIDPAKLNVNGGAVATSVTPSAQAGRGSWLRCYMRWPTDDYALVLLPSVSGRGRGRGHDCRTRGLRSPHRPRVRLFENGDCCHNWLP